jgi:hypothetical protein
LPSESTIITLADAIVESLMGEEFSVPFVPVRAILPLAEPTKATALEVYVVPGGLSLELLTRGPRSLDELIVDVAFLKKLGSDDVPPCSNKEVPPLLALIETVIDFLKSNRKQGPATLATIENNPIYNTAHLREKHTFISVIRLTFKRGA